MKILVLGATGFVGGAIARRLVADGVDVAALVRHTARRGPPLEGVDVRPGDIGDPRAIAAAAEGRDAVVHAAGIVEPRASGRALRWTLIAGTENVLRASAHARVERLVHLSCADVTLHHGDRVHWGEGHALTAIPFGARARALALAEEVTLAGARPGLRTLALRPAWVWGPEDRSRLPALLREARQGGIQLIGRGTNLLATAYIDTVVDAAVRALHAPPEAYGQAYHVADGELLEAREFFGALSDALGLPPPRRGPPLGLALAWARLRGGRGPAGLSPDELLLRGRSTQLDVQRAIGQLGWRPEVSLEEGLDRLAGWVRTVGLDAIRGALRPPPDARSVDAQVAAAGGD
ncbi:MAG: NAD-dependent epimerase/dehydratase family protein [Sandaracinaceae bacterium]